VGRDPIRTVSGIGYGLVIGGEPGSRSLWVDAALRGLWVHGVFTELAPCVFELARALVDYQNRVLPRATLVRLLGSPAWGAGSRALDARVCLLRRALAGEAIDGVPRVETVRGMGYRLIA
jgi:DNA-binding response OmpR family regulator